jgi:hypothetical protein
VIARDRIARQKRKPEASARNDPGESPTNANTFLAYAFLANTFVANTFVASAFLAYASGFLFASLQSLRFGVRTGWVSGGI